MRCHRCNEPLTVFVVGRDYCRLCVAELAKQVRPQPKVQPLWMRNLRAKEMQLGPVA